MSKITTVASTVPVVTEEGSADSAKWRFTGGFLAFSVLSGAAFYMTMSVLVPQRLRDIGIANSTAVLGTINAVGSIASIFIALFIGALSDRTATRWGRRTPWIFCGAFIYGVCFWALSRPISAVIIGLVYVLALIGLNMVQAPISPVSPIKWLRHRVPPCPPQSARAV
ncbi:MFS transporter [Bifidobacterium dentium]|uniref:MFS transporter n=1 Tax=Bifidobacterium dentium TaxID=1689 RepID=UPI001FD7B263|nr:MFS transporter [Bifidobacterium dentium]